jgi:hypothetical protein
MAKKLLSKTPIKNVKQELGKHLGKTIFIERKEIMV